VRALTGLPGFSSPEFCAPQMVAMPVTACDPLVLQRTMMTEYGIEIPCFKWQDHHIVRVSAQGYNSQTQMDRLVAALTVLLPRLSAAA
jgi:isopenicillin-N epimerase